MKKSYIFCLLLLSFNLMQAQTWTGANSTDWNTAGNWNPAVVPTTAGNVVIPGALTNYPLFAGKVTINSIDMQSGSRLDVNGYELTIDGNNHNNNFNGATLNNSNASTDIVLNINTGVGGFVCYFRSNLINDHIVFNLTGSNQFIEGGTAPSNVFNGNAGFNINDVMTVYISYTASSQFNGNLTVTRTVAGATSLFNAGANITGNFSYTNNAGSSTGMGNPGIKTNIVGSINISANYPSPNPFEMFRLINQTPGGSISIQNSQGFNLQKDTLLLTSLDITGYTGSQYANFLNNQITGQVTIADDVSYGSGFVTYIRNNIINGNSSFSNNGTNTFLEGDIIGSENQFLGDVSFNGAGGAVYISYGAPLYCSGNLSIQRTVAGFTQAFNSGATIDGNFTYTNNTTGETYLGNLAAKTSIGGTVNITAHYTTPNAFYMQRFVNQTTGGIIDVQNSQGFDLQKDTLKLSSLSITGFRGNRYATLYNNDITANVTIADDVAYAGGFGSFIRFNIIRGNSDFYNNGSNTFYEADIAGSGNQYLGDVTFYAAGGAMYIAQADSIRCSGNLIINRTMAGYTRAFNAGAGINGNFTYNNNTSGETYLGNVGFKTRIAGLITISVFYTTPAVFSMHRLINQTNGGLIDVQNSLGFDIRKDTIKVTSFKVTGYRGNQYAYLYNNDITGNTTIADDGSYGGGYSTYIRSNVFTGVSDFYNNGINRFYEGDDVGAGNTYNGDVTFNGAGGPLYISHSAPMVCNGNLAIFRTVAGHTQAFNSGAVISGNFTYANYSAGNTYLGYIGTKTSIGGMIDINAIYTTAGAFEMYRLINQTVGGSINVQNSYGFNLQKDTLIVNELNLTGYRGNTYAVFWNNDVTGNLTIADDASFGGGYNSTIRNNRIAGNTSITNNGSNIMFDADGTSFGNKYLGNLSYTRNGGQLNAASAAFNEISGNLTLNSATGIILGKIKFTGSINISLEQLGIQPINIAELTMEKTAAATLTLNDSLSISTNCSFISGIINSSAGKEITFADNSTYSGGSDGSFVNGPVIKKGNDAFNFPVGKLNKIAPISIAAPAVVTDKFKAEYFRINPNNFYDATQKDAGIHHISETEYWMLNRTDGTSNVMVTLSWESSRSGPVNNLSDLRVARWNGSLWKDEGNGITTGSNTAGTIRTLNAVSNFSPFTLASATAANPLPVQLVSFTAAKNNNQVRLQWTAENEINFSLYELERSVDGNSFVIMNTIPAKGNLFKTYYETTDLLPVTGINFYRLKLLDKDGQFTYSEIVKIDFTKNYNITILPNPADDYIIVTGTDEYRQVQILDIAGRLVRQMNKEANHRYNISGIRNGMYFVRLVSQEASTVIRIVVE